MAVKVLVVDDSSFFRRRVSEILEQDSGIEVIGFAVNGREAVEKTAQLRQQGNRVTLPLDEQDSPQGATHRLILNDNEWQLITI